MSASLDSDRDVVLDTVSGGVAPSNRIMGVGLMPEMVRRFDWGGTPLGPIGRWSDTLISNVNQVLFSPLPAILSWGPEFTFFYNEAAIPALQGKHPGALGASYREVYKEVWHIVGQDLEDCFHHGVTAVRENLLIPLLTDGQIEDGYFTYYLIPIFEEGKVAGVYDPYQNMTETVLAKRERDAVAARLGQFLSVTSDAVVGVTRDWRMTYQNATAVRMYGPDLVGKNIWEEFPDAVYEGSPYLEHHHRAMDDGVAGSFEAHYPEPLNLWIQVEVYPTEEGIVIFSRDVSVRKKAEAALLLSEKLAVVGRLATSIAHEINNPLESVTNLLYMVRSSEDWAERERMLTLADEQLRRVSVIATQTLRFHKQSSEPKEITCEVLFSSLLIMFEGKIRNSQIRVESRDRAHRAVKIFEGEIRQVLSNLMSNAIDAMPRGGRLLLRSREGTHGSTGRPGLVLTVADTGCGMSTAVLKRVFEAFFTTKGITGTGLGLWVSRTIVDRQGGSLKVRSSQRAGRAGTVIELFLPFHPERIGDGTAEDEE